MFSQTAEYALRSMSVLASKSPKVVTTLDLADATKVPPAYLSKVLQSLRKAGIVQCACNVQCACRSFLCRSFLFFVLWGRWRSWDLLYLLFNLFGYCFPELFAYIDCLNEHCLWIWPASRAYFLVGPKILGVLCTRVPQRFAFGALIFLNQPQANPANLFYCSSTHVRSVVSTVPLCTPHSVCPNMPFLTFFSTGAPC